MNRRELIPKVGRGVEGTNNVEVGQNSSNLSKRVLDAVRAFSLVAALGVVGAPNKSAEAGQPPANVLQGSSDDSYVLSQSTPLNNGEKFNVVNGKLVLDGNTSDVVGENMVIVSGRFFDKLGNHVQINGLEGFDTTFYCTSLVPNGCFGTTQSGKSYFINFNTKIATDFSNNVDGDFSFYFPGCFLNDKEVLFYNFTSSSLSTFKYNIDTNEVVFLPSSSVLKQKAQNSYYGRLNVAKTVDSNLGTADQLSYHLVTNSNIQVAYGNNVVSTVVLDPEVEKVVGPDLDMGLDMGVSDMENLDMVQVDMSRPMFDMGGDMMSALDMNDLGLVDMGSAVGSDLGVEDMPDSVLPAVNESENKGCDVVGIEKSPGTPKDLALVVSMLAMAVLTSRRKIS